MQIQGFNPGLLSHNIFKQKIVMKKTEKKYADLQKEIKQQIIKLQTGLENHAKRFKSDSDNWGYIGDLEHTKQSLELTIFLP
jgi:hypothetical protein